MAFGKITSSILDMLSMRGPKSSEDIKTKTHEPKNGEWFETKPWEGIKSKNWSKKNEKMKVIQQQNMQTSIKIKTEKSVFYCI